MTEQTKSAAVIYRDCAKCGESVHRNAKVTCKACGGVSPWAVTDAPAPILGSNIGAMLDAAKAAGITGPFDLITPTGSIIVLDSDHISEVERASIMAPAAVLDLNPSDAEVAAFIDSQPDHDALARDEQTAIDVAMTGPHVFLDKFSCMVSSVMAHFKPGQVVVDFPLIKALQHVNAPMVPVAEAPGMACCPQCRHVFSVKRVLPARRAG